ncbi:MAG: CBO0543 family protein [Bacillota bacterium]
MLERFILKFGMTFGILSFPTLFKKPSGKIWFILYLINCLVNWIFDKILVETKQVTYPVRFLPKIFKINVIYDFLVCPYLSVWYCQSTNKSNIKEAIGKLFLYGLPQAAYEIILERKTNALLFIGKWRWFYSLFLVFVVKIISRIMLIFIKRNYEKTP